LIRPNISPSDTRKSDPDCISSTALLGLGTGDRGRWSLPIRLGTLLLHWLVLSRLGLVVTGVIPDLAVGLGGLGLGSDQKE